MATTGLTLAILTTGEPTLAAPSEKTAADTSAFVEEVTGKTVAAPTDDAPDLFSKAAAPKTNRPPVVPRLFQDTPQPWATANALPGSPHLDGYNVPSAIVRALNTPDAPSDTNAPTQPKMAGSSIFATIWALLGIRKSPPNFSEEQVQQLIREKRFEEAIKMVADESKTATDDKKAKLLELAYALFILACQKMNYQKQSEEYKKLKAALSHNKWDSEASFDEEFTHRFTDFLKLNNATYTSPWLEAIGTSAREIWDKREIEASNSGRSFGFKERAALYQLINPTDDPDNTKNCVLFCKV